MGILDLPPVENRKQSKLFFLYGHVGDEAKLKDPDTYITYRLGHDMRYISFFYAVILFSICILYRYFDLLPSLSQPVRESDFLGLYLHYVNYSGAVMMFCLPYYFLLLKKHVNFSECNILRHMQGINAYGDVPSGHKVVFPLMIIASFIFVAKPSAITSLFYMEIFQGFFVQYFDATLFVLLMSVLIAFLHSIFAVLFFTLTILVFHFVYELRKER